MKTTRTRNLIAPACGPRSLQQVMGTQPSSAGEAWTGKKETENHEGILLFNADRLEAAK